MSIKSKNQKSSLLLINSFKIEKKNDNSSSMNLFIVTVNFVKAYHIFIGIFNKPICMDEFVYREIR